MKFTSTQERPAEETAGQEAPPNIAVVGRRATTAGSMLLILYLAAVLSPLVLVLTFGDKGEETFLSQLAMCLPLVGFSILAMQFVLSARMRWVERPFGMDVVYQFHKAMGMFAGVLLLAHPVVVAAADQSWSVLFGLSAPWYIWVGRAALLLLVVHASLAIFRSVLRMEYQKWKAIHSVFALLALTGGLIHSWFAGGDLQLPALRVLWVLLFTGAAASYVWHRFLRPRQLRRWEHRVVDVKQEADDVWTVTLAPTHPAKHRAFLPGQYHYLALPEHEHLPAEEHPFTISSSPTQAGVVSSTIKSAGDFTRSISRVKPGDLMTVHGPFGRFSYMLQPDQHELVFIAGGVGITPLMSMLRHLRDTGGERRVTLLYANKTPGDILFREEISAMEDRNKPYLDVVHMISKPNDNWTGETGRIDVDKIVQHCGNLDNKAFYICGPAGFMDTAVSSLKSLRVPDNRIHFERFDQ